MKAKCTPENSCQGKIGFDTIRESNDHVKNLNKTRKHKKVKSYKCQHCGKYHYGHESVRRMKNLTKPTYIPWYNDDFIMPKGSQDNDNFLNIKNNNL